ncbi:hypothetical protein F0562_001342 [Nyssa sinensis]|uniref:Late embryogenesis abundant protein LEA-2 subgroup domain-containing protein n=1 Tax=Nyssa sinensis TaxID=561372 RepID=A0A5J5C6Q2_9ASTE|nr:hypothetical protein F0562_001342 [Nyssa sinensis]
MASNLKPRLSLLLLSFYILSITANSISEDAPTVYEILPHFGLPSGLLPDSVKSYSLSEDGSFAVELENTCYIQFDYLVYYEKKITGKLKYGSITNLKGIQVQRFLFWFNVDEIRVDLPPSDSIYFQVGIINKKLDVGQFETVHSCRDKVSVSCRQSLKGVLEKLCLVVKNMEVRVFQVTTGIPILIDLPSPVDEIPMLITE